MRLDKFLFEKGYLQSRNRAKEYIENGFVKVDGRVIKRPSFKVQKKSDIEITKKEEYVSRAAEKLKSFLKGGEYEFIKGSICLDVGASTGGFTQVLLQKGALRVYSLDVGSSQLHKTLKNDKRVVNLENTDIRDFFPQERFDVVTCDVSFISLHKILSELDRVSKGDLIILFKPQYEVGKDVRRDKKGVVLDNEAIQKAKERFEKECENLGWRLVRKEISVIKGKEGNEEFFYHFKKDIG